MDFKNLGYIFKLKTILLPSFYALTRTRGNLIWARCLNLTCCSDDWKKSGFKLNSIRRALFINNSV